jgi:hypothetical protein
MPSAIVWRGHKNSLHTIWECLYIDINQQGISTLEKIFIPIFCIFAPDPNAPLLYPRICVYPTLSSLSFTRVDSGHHYRSSPSHVKLCSPTDFSFAYSFYLFYLLAYVGLHNFGSIQFVNQLCKIDICLWHHNQHPG